MKHLFIALFAGLSLGFLGGCSKAPTGSEDNKPAAASEKIAGPAASDGTKTSSSNQVFKVKGVIQKLEPEKKQAVIKHEEIPNYMEAMTMPFEVKNTNELAGLNPGDEVTFTMIVTELEGWIENIKKTGGTNEVQRPPIRVVRNVEELSEGDLMPDYPFTNTLGQAVRLYDHKGKALALTFIFTRCPFPNFCPRMSTNFGTAVKILNSKPAGPTNWHMFSISFDPDFDTPARLRSYAKMYGANPVQWSFVTGAQIEIDAITEQFGLGFAFNKGTFDHNLRTVVIDAAGKVRKIFIGNEWTGEELAEEMKKAAMAKSESPPAP